MSEQDSPHTNQPEKTVSETNKESVPEKVAIEGDLPLTAIDIESQKDMEAGRYHPLRSLDKWFAARPTPAARLAVLGSVLPENTTDDELLQLMQIGPKEKSEDIAEYVIRKFVEKSDKKESNETLDEYYGYPNPNTQSPTQSEIVSFHEKLSNEWEELPTILDPTAGRGIIPFEALRYDLSTIANELNPIPALISKVALEYAPEVGSVTPEIHNWTDKIITETRKRTEKYYPTEKEGRQILNSAMTYTVTCDSCGGDIPLTGKWWLNKTSSGGDAIKPHYENGNVKYEHIKVENNSEFDPADAPVSRGGDAECPHCSVTVDADTIREKFRDDEFEYSVYGVNYETEDGDWGFRAGSEIDQEAIKSASERVESDFEMLDFFSENYPGGSTDRVKNYGVEQWRDLFTPRQLVTHYELFEVFHELEGDILNKYDEKRAELMLVLLAMGIERTLQFNTRLTQWYDDRGYGQYIFDDNNYSMKRMFVDNNICAPRRGLKRRFEATIDDSYEKVVSFIRNTEETSQVYQSDAAEIADLIGENVVDVVVIDPPYFDSIMYGELSDFSYVAERRLLENIFPDLFNTNLVRKEEQAVANPDRHDNPEEAYEEKMKDIFNEMGKVLTDDGILTLMFTD